MCNRSRFTATKLLKRTLQKSGEKNGDENDMKIFQCQVCGQLLYFENRQCEHCGHRLGYLAGRAALSALEPDAKSENIWTALAHPGVRYRFCANAAHDACNWMLDAASAETLCLACRHNRTIPDLNVPENLARWRRFETAKHRLFYTLTRLALPAPSRAGDPEKGLAFDFLAETPGGPKILTGHDHGLITLNLREADDAEREKTRNAMSEPYRTLLGHFRHESGHFYWDRLVAARDRIAEFRELFGDETKDYGEALQKNYAEGPPPDWRESFISTYAASHPWEDFAETWAHYLHIVDTIETAYAFGLRIRPRLKRAAGGEDSLSAAIDFDPHTERDTSRLIDAWLPLTFAVNEINRSMGEPDLYPFVLSPAVIAKLGFVNELVHSS